MAILPVLTIPDPRLKTKAIAVDHVDDTIRTLMDDMLETIRATDGIGLAANQVGVLKRIAVIDMTDDGQMPAPDSGIKPLKMVNPEILWTSEDTVTQNEGCLSVPDQRGEVCRPTEIHVRYMDENNTVQELKTSGYRATCIQHEIDHLNGILYIDHLSRLKREMILRKLAKERRHARG